MKTSEILFSTTPKIYFLICALIISFCSCSSDPCDQTICQNGGVCIEGTCDCSLGWTGSDCTEFDFEYVGEYTSKNLEFSDCNNSSDNATLSANSDDRYCFTNADNNQSCQRLVLSLNEDGSATFTDIRIEIIGGIDFSQPTRIEGSYTTDNEVITFTDQGSTSSLTFNVADDRSGIDWELPSRSSSGCILTHTFSK